MILPRKPGINYIDQKIFVNNLNSWFSNFIIEELRTDYLPDSKIQTIITGTMDPSGGPLPKLFEPSFTTIELGYDYSQEVFDNDIFIFNLDDAYLPDVEFVIRGLQNGDYDKEKILIIVSNVMTWGETPLKIYTEDDMKKEGFCEEEVPEVDDNIIFEEEKNENENKKEEENIEENNNDNQENKEENKENPVINNNENNTLQKEEQKEIKEGEEVEGKNEEDKLGETIEEEEGENESQIKKEEEAKEPEKPKTKIFYYQESEYKKRLPNLKYLYYKILESNALSKNSNPKLKTYVICPGFIYGCGEDFFFNYFRLAWMQKMPYIPIVGEGKNYIPTIHILDLVKIIRKIIEKKPAQKYFFVRDKTKIPTMRNILNSIGMGIGGMPVKRLFKFNIEKIEIPNYTELKIDVRMKLSEIFEEQRKSKENIMDFKDRQFKWHCEYGIPENMDKLREEFNLYRNLKPIKIVVQGPPCGGKTTLCEFLTNKYKLNNYKINQFCDWAKNLNTPLGEETKQKLIEIEENITKALDDYEHRKNKRKTDPPLDTSQLKKFSSEFMGKILKERLSTGEFGTKGYILDNYPKTYEDCVNMFCTTPYDKEKKDKYILIDKIIPDSVIIINNHTEENLRSKLQKTENYEQNQAEIEARFNRRLALYKQQNEGVEEKKKFVKDFYKEYNIDVYFLDEQKYMLNKDEEEKKVIEFLERNGSIDNYGNLNDVDDIIPYIDEPLPENYNMPNEEQILFDQNGPYNMGIKKKVDIIKEENENNMNTDNNLNTNQNEANNANNENASKQENNINIINNNESKVNPKIEKSQMNSASKTLLSKKEETINENEEIKEGENVDKEEQKEEEKGKINESKKEIKVVLTEEQKIELQLKDLKEREKKLLEKKSEVLRRYLSENVMPLLAKGILSVCESMPDDPVDALANFLLENSFNLQKGNIADIEKIMDNE